MNNVQALRSEVGIGPDPRQSSSVATPGQAAPRRPDAPAGPAVSAGSVDAGKKLILLVDSDLRSRESRAKIMRTLGLCVDCAADAGAARARLAAKTYNLVLIDLGRDATAAEALVHEIRTRNSRQLVRFLVGKPLFIATSVSGANPRPRPKPAPAPVAAAEKPRAPAAAALDFGQKIRDAEAAQLGETGGSPDAAGR